MDMYEDDADDEMMASPLPKKRAPIVLAPRDATAARPTPSLPRPRDPIGNVDLRNPNSRAEIEKTMGGQPWDSSPGDTPGAVTSPPAVMQQQETRTHLRDLPPRHPKTGKFMSVDTSPDEEVDRFNKDVDAQIARRKPKGA